MTSIYWYWFYVAYQEKPKIKHAIQLFFPLSDMQLLQILSCFYLLTMKKAQSVFLHQERYDFLKSTVLFLDFWNQPLPEDDLWAEAVKVEFDQMNESQQQRRILAKMGFPELKGKHNIEPPA